MKFLYIIGNGFDLHHKMNTGYTAFRDWLEDNNSSVLTTIDELFGYCDSDWWKRFEENLATAVTSEIVKEEVQENYPDFGSDDFRDADWYAAEYAVEGILSDAYGIIKDAFNCWIANVPMGDEDRKIDLITDEAVFLTFNYTSTLEDLYNISDDKILHIHGKAGTGDELILGHGVSADEIESILEADYPTDEEEGDDYVVQNAKRAAINGVYNQRKNVEEIISKHEEWFNSLNEVTHIYIYGHSLGGVDVPYFEKILSVVKRKDVRIEVSDYNDDNKTTIEEFMKREGIGVEQYSIINLEDKMSSRLQSQ